jgi:class 3 adenylate cyclase
VESTFLFTDLVGFTALTAERGDDHAADVALAFYDVVRAMLAEHGAEEVKPLGDGLMLRADDPCSAIRLGVRIVDEVDASPLLPPVRVGVHHGPAVRRAGDWYGATVNVASRLCSAAAGGEVLVSASTHHAAGKVRGVAFGEPRVTWLRNVAEPVPVLPARSRRFILPPLSAARLRSLSSCPSITPELST